MTNIKDFDSNLLIIDKKSNTMIFITLDTMKSIGDYESINSVNILYFIVGEVNGFIEALKNCTKLWEETKEKIEAINDGEPI